MFHFFIYIFVVVCGKQQIQLFYMKKYSIICWIQNDGTSTLDVTRFNQRLFSLLLFLFPWITQHSLQIWGGGVNVVNQYLLPQRTSMEVLSNRFGEASHSLAFSQSLPRCWQFDSTKFAESCLQPWQGVQKTQFKTCRNKLRHKLLIQEVTLTQALKHMH